MLLEKCAPDLADLVHPDHPHQPFPADQGQKEGRCHNIKRGSELGAKRPLRGSILQAILQFDLLLGGVGSDIQKEASDLEARQRQNEVLDAVRQKLSKRARALCLSKATTR
jgi:hypothetical protein